MPDASPVTSRASPTSATSSSATSCIHLLTSPDASCKLEMRMANICSPRVRWRIVWASGCGPSTVGRRLEGCIPRGSRPAALLIRGGGIAPVWPDRCWPLVRHLCLRVVREAGRVGEPGSTAERLVPAAAERETSFGSQREAARPPQAASPGCRRGDRRGADQVQRSPRQIRVEVLDGRAATDATQELVQDMLAIVTCFAAKLYGQRSQAFRKRVHAAMKEAEGPGG